jgi:hypothetical protein
LGGQGATVTITNSTVNGIAVGKNSGSTTITGPCTTIKGNVQQSWDRTQNVADVQAGGSSPAPAAAAPAAATGAATTTAGCSGAGSGLTVGGVTVSNPKTATVTGPGVMIHGTLQASWNVVTTSATAAWD